MITFPAVRRYPVGAEVIEGGVDVRVWAPAHRHVAVVHGPDGEAERRTARFVAPPGHSQHQLGTAVDFSSWEVNYAIQPKFAETEAARWLEQNAWQYGFVVRYTEANTAVTSAWPFRTANSASR